MESRLQLLESALGRLFPSGELEAITRALHIEELPIDQVLSTAQNNQVSVYDPLASDPMIWDDAFHANLSSPGETGSDLQAGPGIQDRSSLLEDFLTDASHTPDLLATTDEETEFLNNYFLHYHTLYPILHEGAFRLECQSQIHASPYWPILANIALAIGAWLTAHARDSLDKKYFAEAEGLFQKVHSADRGDITLVQSLVLLSAFSQKQASPEESGHYIGTAVRMAISLNLHIKPSDSGCNELEKEIRRRVWWCVYCAESCSAKTFGRPLLLPEEMLITVEPVSNIYESALTSSSALFPTRTDDPTVYTGLIQQSSYHSMANRIYRRLLSTPSITPQDVHEVDEMINAWHGCSSFCTQLTDPLSTPEWYLTARRRQILCDQSLRLLIHRPLLLKWFRNRSMETRPPTEKHADESRCRAQGLSIARTTIGLISESIINGHYSRLTLSFMLYAFFHALIVPLIHLKAEPSSPESISCIQDIKTA